MTKQDIINAVSVRTGVDAKHIDLVKDLDGYHWSGNAGMLFKDSLTGVMSLSEVTLENWVEDFESRCREAIANTDHVSFNAYVESIDFSIEYT